VFGEDSSSTLRTALNRVTGVNEHKIIPRTDY
jgi:hypothetical protein